MTETFEFEGKRSAFFWPGFLISVVFFALAFIVSPAWAIFATFPLTVALISIFSRIPQSQVEISDSGIEDRKRMVSVQFSDVRGIWCGGVNLVNHQIQPDSQRLVIEHSGGAMDFYDRDLAKLASFTGLLLKTIERGNTESLRAPFVNEYWIQEKNSFGENLIQVCRQAPPFISKSRSRDISGPLAAVAAMMAVVLWIVFVSLPEGGRKGDRGNFVVGAAAIHATLFTITAVISLIVYFANQKKFSGKGNAALVISPRGFALAQNDLDGSITWNEVKAIKKSRLGLIVVVAGATIVILDIYDLPLAHIFAAMQANLA